MPMQGEYKNSNLTFFDTVISPPRGTFVAEQFPVLVPQIDFGAGFYIEDDFFTISVGTGLAWQAVKGTGGTLALASALGGQINIPTAAASANDYQLLSSQAAHFNLRANKPMIFEVALSLTEANTNTASWFAGLSSTTTSGFIQNSGAPAASYSGAIFWKATGAMSLKFQTSNSTTQNSVTLGTVVSGTQYVLGCVLNPNDGTTGLVTPYVNQIASGVNTNVFIGATQNLTLASLAAMNLIFGVKTGSTSAETLVVDWARCYCAR